MAKQTVTEVKQAEKLSPDMKRWYDGYMSGRRQEREEIIEEVIKFLNLDERYQRAEEMD